MQHSKASGVALGGPSVDALKLEDVLQGPRELEWGFGIFRARRIRRKLRD